MDHRARRDGDHNDKGHWIKHPLPGNKAFHQHQALALVLKPGVLTFFGFPRHLPGLGYDIPHLFRVHAGNTL